MKHMIPDKKIILIIAWNPLKCHVLKDLPKESIFNVEYYQDNICAKLIHIRPGENETKLYLYADNEKTHTVNKC
jgi:hypothetical protein